MPEAYEVVPFTRELIPAVQAFNERLLAGGLEKALLYPESHIPRYPPREGAQVLQEYFLLLEDQATMRGGFILTHERWSFSGKPEWAAHIRLPIAEAAVDRRFKGLGTQIFHSAMAMQPKLCMFGMGGLQTSVARRLRSLGWSMESVPFYFRIFRPGVFLRTSPYLRKKPLLRLGADVAAVTGLAAAGLSALQFLGGIGVRRAKDVRAEQVSTFAEWADEVWEQGCGAYAMAAVRDSATLNARYPAEERQFLKLRFSRGGKAVGWAVLLDTRMRGSKYFGDARVGALVDYFSSSEHAETVIRGATDFLQSREVDIVVSNQTHHAWRRVLRRCGYLRGPSNYLFALAPNLAERVRPLSETFTECFVTRGDGAGPERLMKQ
jgi:hypothetical protein